MARLGIRSGVTLFSDAELQSLLEQALVVWRQTPFQVQGTDEVFDLLRAFGCSVDGTRVGFPPVVIDKVLARCERGERGWGWCGAGAATVGAQSILEKALGFGMAMAMGVRSFGVGCLAFSDVGSPVQLQIDLELAGFARSLFRPVATDAEHIGLETIADVAPRGGRYLETPHTARFFREECWLPALCDFRAYAAWANQPNELVAKASARAATTWGKAPNPCPLNAAQQTHIRQLMAEADRASQAGQGGACRV